MTSAYPQNWKALSGALKECANWTCQRCDRIGLRPGEIEVDPAQRRRRILNLHHIDRDTSNNAISNLAVLCQPCHLDLHRCDRFGKAFNRDQMVLVQLVQGVWVKTLQCFHGGNP